MNAEYGYFTENDGEIHFLRDPESVDKKLAEIGYFVSCL